MAWWGSSSRGSSNVQMIVAGICQMGGARMFFSGNKPTDRAAGHICRFDEEDPERETALVTHVRSAASTPVQLGIASGRQHSCSRPIHASHAVPNAVHPGIPSG